MSIRVVDQARWTRTKGFVAFLCWLVALGCAGGLEGEESIPSVAGFITFISASALITWNIFKQDRRR